MNEYFFFNSALKMHFPRFPANFSKQRNWPKQRSPNGKPYHMKNEIRNEMDILRFVRTVPISPFFFFENKMNTHFLVRF